MSSWISSISRLTEEASDLANMVAGRAEGFLNDVDQRASTGLAGTPLGPPATDALGGVSPEERRLVRQLMIKGILATDMTYHFSLKAELDAVIL